MSAPVDVLARIDTAIERAIERGAHKNSQAVRELREARAAVAELIEADREYDAAEQELVDLHKPFFRQNDLWRERQAAMEARCDAAIARRAAALARVGGAT